MSEPVEQQQRKTSAWAKVSLVFAALALVNTVVNWLLVLAGQLDEAVEIGGISVFILAAIAVGCAIVAMIRVWCCRATRRGAGLAALAVLLAVLAAGGFYVPLILLFCHMQMF